MKDKYLRARIDGDEYKLIAQRAKNKGLSLSQYVRFMIDKGERCTCKEDSRYTGNGEEW